LLNSFFSWTNGHGHGRPEFGERERENEILERVSEKVPLSYRPVMYWPAEVWRDREIERERERERERYRDTERERVRGREH
jgi:hypothetical protein